VISNPGHPRRFTRAATLFLAILSTGVLARCAMFRKLDMVEIHQESALRQERNPVIVIHGFIGSKLRNARTHGTVWGRFVDAIKRGKPDDLSLPIDSLDLSQNRDELVAYDIYESVVGVKFYGGLLDSLREAGGYHFGDIKDPRPGDTAFVYYYDWRRDNVESAIGLGRAIQHIKDRLHAPEMRFDIVAHSMGGMLAQYYLKYGTEDVVRDGRDHPVTYAGAPNLARVVLLGAPNRGTMSAFRILNTGFSRTMSPEVMFTMPSLYQLLPYDGRGHFVDPKGNPVDVDLYDASTWVRNGWSVFNPNRRSQRPQALRVKRARPSRSPWGDSIAHMRSFLQAALERARAFHAALEREGPEDAPVPIHIFGSDCIPTLDCAVLKQTPKGTLTMLDDEATPDRDVRQIEKVMIAPGDGTVTADSLLAVPRSGIAATEAQPARNPAFSSIFFFCETHGMLPTNLGFQKNLFYVLFHSPERPAPFARAGSGR
jgi:pimeloyl-ACP methyl ester carboxylesterase